MRNLGGARWILQPGAWPEPRRTVKRVQYDVEVAKRRARWYGQAAARKERGGETA